MVTLKWNSRDIDNLLSTDALEAIDPTAFNVSNDE